VSDYSIGYQQLQDLAQQAGLQQSGAEMHGRMLGMMCVDCGRNRDVLARLACDEDAESLVTQELREAVEGLYRETWSALDGVGTGFSLLLPEEGDYLQRCQALIDWARGFLRGLALVGVHGGEDLELRGRHALADIARIAECDPAEVPEDLDAFEEACEFVWVATVLVRELLVVDSGDRH